MFVLTVPTEKKHSISRTVQHIAEAYFAWSFKRRKKNLAGYLALKYIKTLPVPDGGSGGLIGFCLKKGGRNFENAHMVMTKELHKHWEHGVKYTWEFCLDKFLIDYDIRELLQHYLNMHCWEDCNEELRSTCFKYYPTRDLPQWNIIMTEAWWTL